MRMTVQDPMQRRAIARASDSIPPPPDNDDVPQKGELTIGREAAHARGVLEVSEGMFARGWLGRTLAVCALDRRDVDGRLRTVKVPMRCTVEFRALAFEVLPALARALRTSTTVFERVLDFAWNQQLYIKFVRNDVGDATALQVSYSADGRTEEVQLPMELGLDRQRLALRIDSAAQDLQTLWTSTLFTNVRLFT